MTARAIWTIGAGQCVSWGVLYYAFGVLLVPVERDLGVARWVVTGAFSTALLISAVAAPTIGRLTDRGRGPAVMQAGGLIAAGLLVLWALAPSVWMSYGAWAALGLCMAAILYEPVFAIVGRAIENGTDRLRAIATITVLGGLASTISLPVTGWLVDQYGWRSAVWALGVCLAGTTLVVHRVAFQDSRPPSRPAGTEAACSGEPPLLPAPRQNPHLARPALIFACASFTSSALATNLIPALIERRLSATTAATLAGLFGVMQLPGRLLVMNARFSLSPTHLIWASMGLQVAGLAALVSATSPLVIATGVTLFACGSGLATLARPYLVLTWYGANQSGRINGTIARAQQIARAAGPISGAALASLVGYGLVFALLAGLLSTTTLALQKGRR